MNRDGKGFRRVIWYILAAAVVIFLVGGYAFSSYYKLEHVEVMGTSRYSDEEVKEMVLHGIAAENTVLASRLLSRSQITDIPFVDSITVTALARDTVAISVHEKKAVGCFPYLDSYIYFDRKGKRVILEERYCDKKCYIYDCGDVYYEPKWKLKNDTIIILGIKERKLTIISDSVIVTEDKEHHISDTLYKVTNPQLLKKLKKVPIP